MRPDLGRLRKRAEKESKERESASHVLGKWFMENFSVNRFPNFTQRFSSQQKTFYG
jgi:hypothetical protein